MAFFRCKGCDTATYRLGTWFSEEPGEWDEYLYPLRGQQERSPKLFEAIQWGGPLDSAYRQTVAAYNSTLFILAGAGVRLVIEGVCKDQKVEDGPIVIDKAGEVVRKNNLEGKINGLVEKSFISSKQAEALHQIRFLGNDAAHELFQPTKRTVELAIDLVEHLLEQVYDQPEKGKVLAARKRPKK